MSRPSAVARRRTEAVGRIEAADIARRIGDGSTRILVGVSGPGGFGKSTLLEELADALHAVGATVLREFGDPGPAEVDYRRTVLLLDDVDSMDDDEVERLLDLSRADGPHLVAAFRPWPRSGAMASLAEQLARQRPLILLHQLSAADIRRRADTLLGAALSDDDIERILELSRGNPRLVDALVVARGEDGPALWDAAELPPLALDRIRDELDGLDEDLAGFLLALAAGFSLSGPTLATAPRFAAADIRSLIAAARASGLVEADGSLLPIVRTAILQSSLAHELWSMRRDLVDAFESARVPLGDLAVELARSGFRDKRVAEAVRSRADALLRMEPREAGLLYAAAIEAGDDGEAIAGRRAQAAWAIGDIRTAERLVDGMLARRGRSDLPRIVDVAASIWARKGMLQRSIDAYLALADPAGGTTAPLAAICLAGIGEVRRARSILESAADPEYPTSSQVALTLMAEGIVGALEGSSEHGLTSLLQASSVMSESAEVIPLPEAPAVLAALVALNAGELDIADAVLQSAVDAEQGGPAFAERLRLVQALVALRADRPARARTHLHAAESTSQPLGLRDEMLAHAVKVGLARRTDDIPSLIRAWNVARQSIVRMPIDLYGLPALAELSIAAARLHESHLVETHLASAWDLLERAGEPACWSTNLHWAAIQAAILGNSPDEFARHADALRDAAAGSRAAGRLARAARTWFAALAGNVDVDEVESAVRDLASGGYPWDAGRLAGHAAARAAEHKDTLRLLALARSLHPDDAPSDPAPRDGEDGPDDVARSVAREESVLSAREREVARMVLEGKTYAEIGTAIFISPRTAEHHIARIRRRLGVSTRSELIARLRLVLGDEPGH